MNWKVNEIAKLTGVTVRALHYYDRIGLLKPNAVTDAGYRLYDEKNLETLQQILFFRELDFSLHDIGDIINNPDFDRKNALEQQKKLLSGKRKQLDGLITLIDKIMKGDSMMSFKEFDHSELEETKKKYAAEAKERWGGTKAYAESEKKAASYGKKEWETIQNEMKQLLKTFAEWKQQGKDPGCEEVQHTVMCWQEHITRYYYSCTKEILSGLGTMYAEDERFRKNIDECGEGTADFLSKAIAVYCS